MRITVLATYWSLALAAVCLWLPRDFAPRVARTAWMVAVILALAFAVAGGLIDTSGLAALAVLAAAARGANHTGHSGLRALAHVVVVAISTGLFLHVLPGFANPLMLDRVVLSPGAEPYTQYVNVDKGLAGLLLLGVYVPERVEHDRGARYVAGFLWRFLVVVIAVIALSLATGYVRWDPKLPSWWPMWLGIMLVLTALPEEAAFRGVIQAWLAERRGNSRSVAAIVAGGLAFGVAHVAGGPIYVLVASAAGIGYGWIYASTGSIGAAILAHAGLNAIHFALFTYPSLAVVR